MYEEKIELGRCPTLLLHYDITTDSFRRVIKFERYKGSSVTGYVVWYE